ncbi:unnamed protein product [Rhizoctonia solani]|uniref:Zn(2)-C6 fungal-type domain-containing protein n=1 Tax=Rhizoctonia solani TaxID=456999 RepID=A0A8H3AK72_9AGAM|nr:unnamed protein product [Rhizoctonia solani]
MLGTRTKRTAGPCDHCKRRKRKCDARMPTCAACERSNIECLYTANSEQRRPVHRQYVASLEARISLLEKILKDAEASDTTDSSDAGVSLPDENDFQSQSLTATSGSSLPPSPSTKIAPESQLTLIDDPGDILKSTLDPTTPLNSEEPDLGMSGYEIILSLEHEHKLLAQFWDWQRMHHPYVVPVPFLSAYAVHSELAHPGEPIPPPPPPPPNSSAGATLNVPRASTVKRTSDLPHFISPLLLYSMFAIAALFSGDPGTGTLFYQHARETLLREAANPKVATIQAVCLMTTWELGHARSPAAWALFGVALSLCIRLGLNVDATPLLQSGEISQRLYETRNFVFWGTFYTDRFLSICMGMRPLIDYQIISTPTHSSPTGESKLSTTQPRELIEEIYGPWWSPCTSGMGNVLVQAIWDTCGELTKLMDSLFDSVYNIGASTRTPREILQLVDRNHLAVQKFIEDLPTWLRTTGVIKRKNSGLVYLHLFIHLTNILVNRPFLSTHHSIQTPLTRQYRTLAFRTARASALQVSSLIRHIPLSSPCVTIPYIVYSACTILLLTPEDSVAMDGVRTSLACLDGMDETGYWVESARDAARRIRALAEKWGVGLETSRRVLGLFGGRKGEKVHGAPPSDSAPSTCSNTTAVHALVGTLPQIPAPGPLEIPRDSVSPNGNAYIPTLGHSDLGLTGYEDPSVHLLETRLANALDAGVNQVLSEAHDSQDYRNETVDFLNLPTYLPIEKMADSVQGLVLPISQPLDSHSSIHHQTLLAGTAESTYHRHVRMLRPTLPHVAYANSHADPQHDMHLPHSHWHTIIPAVDLNIVSPPDPGMCTDLGTCFNYTVEHTQDPAFIDLLADPFMNVSMDWVRDSSLTSSGHTGAADQLVGMLDGYEFVGQTGLDV